jgi:hypothetical protein
MLILER